MLLFHSLQSNWPSQRYVFFILATIWLLMSPGTLSAQAMTEYMMLQGQVQQGMQQGVATATAPIQQQSTVAVQNPIQAATSTQPTRPGGITVTFSPVQIGVMLTLGGMIWMLMNR